VRLNPFRSRPALCWLALATTAGADGRSGILQIDGVPHIQQAPDFCGEACAAMYLQKLGYTVSQNDVFDATGVDPSLGRGAYTNELARALTRYGFDVGTVWTRISPSEGNAGVEREWRSLFADLSRGVPSIVCMHYDASPHTTEHFRLVLGYDPSTDEVIFHEPAEADGAYRRMPRPRFLALWTFKPAGHDWTLIRMKLDPKQISIPQRRGEPDEAQIAQHVLKLKETMPAGFTVVVQSPFIVVGDEAPAKVRQRAEDTVRWTSTLLHQDFFPESPRELTDVWIFKDAQSYVSHAKSLFHETPTTPYGYYSPAAKAMLMNIKPGAGTLVHELVHPFMHANAPDCPAWINEGLASLYERPGEKSGHIYGYPNWRLPALQQALQHHDVPSFGSLAAMSDDAFYEDDEGTNYAEARYIAYYLQEKGVLRDFFSRYLSNRAKDPSGYLALRGVLGDDMPSVERDWRKFVLTLRNF
jgi:hypothetical protein